MMSIQPQRTVGDLVRERPHLSQVFERLGIDYCCGGKVSLAQACAQRSLDARTVCNMLEAIDSAPAGPPAFDADRHSLHEVIENIKTTHHAFLRQELPRLGQMLQRVVAAHAGQHVELHELERVFAAFTEELMTHMHKEEFVLFPMIDRLESTGQSQRFHCGSLRNPIGVMEQEHDAAGAAMRRMRELTNGYTAPADACNTWRALLEGLARIESDMHQHVHKENSILFPKAVALESTLTERAGAVQ